MCGREIMKRERERECVIAGETMRCISLTIFGLPYIQARVKSSFLGALSLSFSFPLSICRVATLSRHRLRSLPLSLSLSLYISLSLAPQIHAQWEIPMRWRVYPFLPYLCIYFNFSLLSFCISFYHLVNFSSTLCVFAGLPDCSHYMA